MKLTKKKRNEIYKRVLEDVKINGWKNCGFCYHLTRQTYDEVDAYMAMRKFPEIKKYKPEKSLNKINIFFWFKTSWTKDRTREKILRQAIKETQD